MIIFQEFDSEFEKIKQIVVPHNQQYCDKYNIKYEVFDHDYTNFNLKKYWNKILILEQMLLFYSYDWVLMLDGDIILYPDNNIELITKLISNYKDFAICRISDKLSDCFWNINIGSLFVRNTEFAKSIIKNMIYIGAANQFNIYEQPVFQNMLKSNYMGLLEKTEIFSPQAFNHTGGPFVFHPCGADCTTTIKDNDGIRNKIKYIQQEIERVKI